MKSSPQDPARPERDLVDLENEHDVETWTRSLNISRQELQRAVEAAGPEAGSVYDFIWRSRQMGN